MAGKTTARASVISAEMARRLFLHAQGLLDDPARPANAASLEKLIERMGFVQIDTINVIERAHHLTLLSRLDGYRPGQLAGLLERKRVLFEHWTHDASAIPVKWFAHWQHRFERYRRRDRQHAWWKTRMGPGAKAVIAGVLKRVEKEGPLMSKDFERPRDDGPGVKDAWWQWKPHKAALEYLWRCGELAVARRVHFHKVYDLTERVLPEAARLSATSRDEHVMWACETALDRLGVATPTQIAAFWRAIGLSEAARWCKQAARDGRIVEISVESADGSQPKRMFAPADWSGRIEKALALQLPDRIRLLSPFDPVLRDRAAAQRLFNFEYRFEAFVPEPKRRFGYYVMPILRGDRLIGRLDPKFHRDKGVLAVRRVWWEPRVRPTAALWRELEGALERLAAALGAGRVELNRRG